MVVRETSIKCYDEIKEDGFKDTWEEIAYTAVKNTPMMTAREYYDMIIIEGNRQDINPRLTELKKMGKILEFGKRQCSIGKKLAYILTTLEGLEKTLLRKVGFIEKQDNLFVMAEDDIIVFQDFRKGKRRSYAFNESGQSVDYKYSENYKEFKDKLNKAISRKLSPILPQPKSL